MSMGGLAGSALAGSIAHKMEARQGVGSLLCIAGLFTAMGGVLLLPQAAYIGLMLCGFGVMAAAMLFNVWFFARLQTLVPQQQVGRVTGCCVAAATLTQPVGQAAYGWLFQRFAACPAAVLAGAGILSAALLAVFLARMEH